MTTSDPDRLNRPQDPTTTYVDVTPALASEWLEGKVHNRPIKWDKVKQYSRDMSAGNWDVQHQGIAFNPSNKLIDGQKRLWAIIECGCTIRMAVSRNVPDASIRSIDTGDKRDAADIATMTNRWGKVTRKQIAVLRRMLKGHGGWLKMSQAELDHQIGLHITKIRLAERMFVVKKRGLTASAVVAVISRAAYSVPDDRLRRFVEVLSSGDPGGDAAEKTIMTLRSDLQRRRDGRPALHPDAQYRSSEAALRAYLDGEALGEIHGAPKELFELEGEQ